MRFVHSEDHGLHSPERELERVDRFGADLLVVSLGLDMFDGDPIADLAMTTDGFARSGSLVSELGLPTVALQEGGYATDQLGLNAKAWLTGLEAG